MEVTKAVKGQIRIIVCDTTKIINDICSYHNPDFFGTEALGRVISATTIMGSMLKEGQSICLSFKGNGTAGLITAESNWLNEVKAFISNPEGNDSKDGSLKKTIGEAGTFKIIKDLKLKSAFTSENKTVHSDVTSEITDYFFRSEQTPTLISMGQDIVDKGKVKNAGIIAIQLMPKFTEDELKEVEDITSKILPYNELSKKHKTSEQIIHTLFKDAKLIGVEKAIAKCNCSVGKTRSAATAIPLEERKAICEEQGYIEVKCNYCKTSYRYDEKLNAKE